MSTRSLHPPEIKKDLKLSLQQLNEQRRPVRVVVIGPSNWGKTSLLNAIQYSCCKEASGNPDLDRHALITERATSGNDNRGDKMAQN
jgi:GTPase SAR1 family protein